MAKLKTIQAIAKRVRITKSGKGKKVMKRIAGQDHFNSRETGKTRRNKRRDESSSFSDVRNIRRALGR